MPQVVRTVNQLIINSLYLTGELGVGETPNSFMLTTGLDILNAILDSLDADSIYVPYLTTVNFTLQSGQGTYSISDMETADITADRVVDLSFANYSVPTTGDTVLVYPLRVISKAEYYNIVRQNNLQSRPGFIFLDKQALESFITLYPVPNANYPCSIQFKAMINALSNQDTLGELPPFYYEFLKYAIARQFIAYYPSANWPQTNEDHYREMYQTLKNANETDLTIRPSNVLTAPEPYYWPNILVY